MPSRKLPIVGITLGIVAIALVITFRFFPPGGRASDGELSETTKPETQPAASGAPGERARVSALLQVDGLRGRGLIPETLPAGEILDRLLASRVAQARSREVMEAAVTRESPESQELRKTKWFTKDKDTGVDRLEKQISISVIPKTDLIQVSMAGADKDEAPVIINAVAVAIVDHLAESTCKHVNEDLRRLAEMLAALEKELAEAQRRASAREPEDRPEPARIAECERQAAARIGELRLLEAEIAKLQFQRVEATIAFEAIKNVKPEEIAELPEVQQAVESDKILQGLRERRINLLVDQENAKNEVGPEHADVAKLQKRIATIDGHIQERRVHVASMRAVSLRKERETALATIAQQLIALQAEHRKVDAEAKDFTRDAQTERAKHEAVREALGREQQQAHAEIMSLTDRKSRIERRLDELRLEQRVLAPVVLLRRASAAE